MRNNIATPGTRAKTPINSSTCRAFNLNHFARADWPAREQQHLVKIEREFPGGEMLGRRIDLSWCPPEPDIHVDGPCVEGRPARSHDAGIERVVLSPTMR